MAMKKLEKLDVKGALLEETSCARNREPALLYYVPGLKFFLA